MVKNLWAESIISGFTVTIGLFFCVLVIFEVTDLCFLIQVKDYLTYISIALVALSYVLGITTMRITQIIFILYIKLTKGSAKQGTGFKQSTKMPRIWNEGNERLLRELDIQYSFFTLFRVLSAGFFINAIFVTWWLELAGFEQWSLKIFVTLATLFLIFLGLTVYQKRVWDRLKIKAFKVVSGWYTSR